MNAANLLLGFLSVALSCAIVILIAFAILWVLRWMGAGIDANVLRWGKIVVGLICLIFVVGWLLSVLGSGNYGPHLLLR
jgi:hypothetical protein